MVNSYPSIYNLGHAAIADLTKGPVIVEEKVDGSQISFRLNEQGGVDVRSKGAQINVVAPEGMFTRAIESILSRRHKMRHHVTYRGEYLNTPHHNALTYDRVPNGHIIIFDVDNGLEAYATPEDKAALAAEIGLECVPVLFRGVVTDAEHFRRLMDTQSVLGGQKIEGVVIKPEGYALFGRDKKVLMGKFVSEAFREVHNKTWDAEHKTPGSNDIIQILGAQYISSARWQKAVQHLREAGKLQNAPQDIGLLMKEIPDDILKECKDGIAYALFDWAWPQLRRRVVQGVPEWYKDSLLKLQFKDSEPK